MIELCCVCDHDQALSHDSHNKASAVDWRDAWGFKVCVNTSHALVRGNSHDPIRVLEKRALRERLTWFCDVCGDHAWPDVRSAIHVPPMRWLKK